MVWNRWAALAVRVPVNAGVSAAVLLAKLMFWSVTAPIGIAFAVIGFIIQPLIIADEWVSERARRYDKARYSRRWFDWQPFHDGDLRIIRGRLWNHDLFFREAHKIPDASYDYIGRGEAWGRAERYGWDFSPIERAAFKDVWEPWARRENEEVTP